ncbi:MULTISPECIES: DUF4279 domain-containing protein [Rossellomorea]|jgi:hypothetical protein|uniref:DUF4279 domain-containing protein n=1 Tax=Rossellomorea aquimaris TaxID=189382 RepID=A0A5D4TUA7_9BACI|nr:DUF4279 domain-containing protein [Rossellomorea aquimaris]TYS77992.1 DUF4279 domain-containing protein [Rossellomorea aquimaris]TYS87174.1 DUF4279 domain-containing protein [Rossellomorea aquimaris]
MNTEINVEFCIYGDELNPDEITRLLELQPSLSYRKDDFIRDNGLMKRLEGCWEINTGYAPSVDINDALSKMKEILDEKTEKILQIKRTNTFDCKMTIVIKIYNNNVPGMYFSPSTLSFIVNDLEAEMDICTYVM